MFSRPEKRFSRIETTMIKVLIWTLVFKGAMVGDIDTSFLMFLMGA